MQKAEATAKEAPPKKRVFKQFVAKPDRQGVVVIPHNFIPTHDMDEKSGEWLGMVPEE